MQLFVTHHKVSLPCSLDPSPCSPSLASTYTTTSTPFTQEPPLPLRFPLGSSCAHLMDRSSTDLLAAASLPVIMSASWSPPSENQIFANLFPQEKKWTTMTTMHNYNNNPSDFSGVATLCCSTWMVAMFVGYKWCESEYIGAGKQQITECNIDASECVIFYFFFNLFLFYFISGLLL